MTINPWMSWRPPSKPRLRSLAALLGTGMLVAAGCGSSGKSSTATTASPGSSPSAMFSTANVSGLGTVVVDAKGRTVYILTADGKTNVPCEDSTGCTKAWPDLPFPDGTTAAKAGAGVQASLLGSMKLSDGETYPVYNNWLMYEFAGDKGPGQGHGEGIKSFGGTWYALDASGNLVMPGAAGATATTSGSSGGGYG